MTTAEPYPDAQAHADDELALVRGLVERALARERSSSAGEPAPQLIAGFVDVEQRLAAARATSAPPPIDTLRRALSLSLTEYRALWTLIAYELDPRIRRLMRQLAGDDGPALTVGMVLAVVHEGRASGLAELGTNGTLARLAVIEHHPADVEAPASQRRCRVADRVLELAGGLVRLAPEVAAFASVVELEPTGVERLELGGDAAARLEHALADREAGVVVVHGRRGSGRRSLAAAVAAARGQALLVVDAAQLAAERATCERQLRAIARECRLLGLVPLFRELDVISAGEPIDRIDLIEQVLDAQVLATSTRPIARRWRRPPTEIELPPLGSAQRAKVWSSALPATSAADADALATMYPLAPALIHAASDVARRQCGDGALRLHHVVAGIRSVIDDRLGAFATRIVVTQDWADLVLPADQLSAIAELLARVRERGRVYDAWGFGDKLGKGLGVSALFSGPPGTGKTMAAGLIARDLGIDVYQVDLSRISSKWIGETEKNLAALFDAAEAGHAILLFDEADALFGKRTEVRSSNDRHANQETNYLLQRMERFSGICVLTTNHETAIDEAFRRRLSIHVRFPVPEVDERERLWRAMLPANAPVAADLDLATLATTFALSGGYIRNAVVRAAFLAAGSASTITADALRYAARLECEAMGKVVRS